MRAIGLLHHVRGVVPMAVISFSPVDRLASVIQLMTKERKDDELNLQSCKPNFSGVVIF